MRPPVPLSSVAAFLFFFGLAVINSSSQVIFQKKVAPDVQGRVFALNEAVAGACLPIAYVIAGPLADNIFEPFMASDGLISGIAGQIIGVGPGRGIGLLFIIIGTLTIVATAAAYFYPRLRLLEKEQPDEIGEGFAVQSSVGRTEIPRGEFLSRIPHPEPEKARMDIYRSIRDPGLGTPDLGNL